MNFIKSRVLFLIRLNVVSMFCFCVDFAKKFLMIVPLIERVSQSVMICAFGKWVNQLQRQCQWTRGPSEDNAKPHVSRPSPVWLMAIRYSRDIDCHSNNSSVRRYVRRYVFHCDCHCPVGYYARLHTKIYIFLSVDDWHQFTFCLFGVHLNMAVKPTQWVILERFDNPRPRATVKAWKCLWRSKLNRTKWNRINLRKNIYKHFPYQFNQMRFYFVQIERNVHLRSSSPAMWW